MRKRIAHHRIALKILVALLFAGDVLQASSIPADRTYSWQPHVNVGVPGGIPNRTTIYTNITGTNGQDISSALTSALSACPSNQVIRIAQGRFKLSSRVVLQFGNNKTLRGAGMGKTILDCYATNGTAVLNFGAANWPPPVTNLYVSSGADAGSTNLAVTNTSNITVGKMITLSQLNPDYVFSTGGFERQMSCMLLVTGKTATNIYVSPAVPAAFTNSPAIGIWGWSMTGNGVEDLTINLTNSSLAGIWMEQNYGSWVKNVEIVGSNSRQLWFANSMNLEVRGCYTRDARTSGPGHEGIDLQTRVCWSLIEDNVSVRGGFPMIILGDAGGGCAGNVISYNYLVDVDSGGTTAGAALSVNHGPHNTFNLFEGNVAQMFQSDGYFGSASDNTAYRNWFTGVYAPGTLDAIAVSLSRWSYRFNFYNNVLGSNGYTAAYDTEVNGYTKPLIWRLGYPNMGNAGYSGTNPPGTNAQALDLTVKNTILRTNNFDYASGGIVNPFVGEMPASLIYNSAPSWWGTNRWPAIDPDNAVSVAPIPAQARYLIEKARQDITPPSNFQLAPK